VHEDISRQYLIELMVYESKAQTENLNNKIKH